jgi:hypothetical protein
LGRDGTWTGALSNAGADDGTSQLTALTADTSGNMLAGESSYGSVTLRKLRASGTPVWTHTYPSLAATDLALASDDDGNVWFAGSFARSLDLGGKVLTAPTDDSIFLLKISR